MIELEVQSVGTKFVDDLGNISATSARAQVLDLSVSVKDDQLSTDSLISVLVDALKKDKKIYFVYSESIPTRISRMKSYKKIFYEERKAGVFRKDEVFEAEVETGSTQSVVTAIISPRSSASVQYVLSNLLDSRLKMVLFVDKNKRSFRLNKREFLRTMVMQLGFDDSRTLFLSPDKIANRIVTEHRSVIHPNPFPGNRKLDILANRPVYRSVRRILNQYRQSVLN